jgi:hypothetical protein
MGFARNDPVAEASHLEQLIGQILHHQFFAHGIEHDKGTEEGGVKEVRISEPTLSMA